MQRKQLFRRILSCVVSAERIILCIVLDNMRCMILAMETVNAQTLANKRWQKKNPLHAKYLSDRSRARTFIRSEATMEDLNEFDCLIDNRRKELQGHERTDDDS